MFIKILPKENFATGNMFLAMQPFPSLVPSPRYPFLQEQLKLPATFLQIPFASHGLFFAHSSISTTQKLNHIFIHSFKKSQDS